MNMDDWKEAKKTETFTMGNLVVCYANWGRADGLFNIDRHFSLE
jgi:hypothetical protein